MGVAVKADEHKILCYALEKPRAPKVVAKMPKVMPVSDLQRNFKAVAQECEQSKEPIYLTRNGYPALVVMDAAAYEKESGFLKRALQREMELLEQLEEADAQIEAGDFTSLDHVRELRAKQ